MFKYIILTVVLCGLQGSVARAIPWCPSGQNISNCDVSDVPSCQNSGTGSIQTVLYNCGSCMHSITSINSTPCSANRGRDPRQFGTAAPAAGAVKQAQPAGLNLLPQSLSNKPAQH